MAENKTGPQLAIDLKKIKEQVGRWPGPVRVCVEDSEVLPKGTKVSLEVPWPNGNVHRMSGILVCIRDGEAYVETSVGAVVGPAESVEVEE